MVRLKWTFVLILISVTLLATVITAFRIRDLQKSSHDSAPDSKRRQKCEDCDVNKLDLDHKHVYKVESGKRSREDLKKIAQGTIKSVDEKTFEEVAPVTEETDDDSDEEDDEGDESLIYLRQLASKWEEKQKASGVVSKLDKKVSHKEKVPHLRSSDDNFQDNKLKHNEEESKKNKGKSNVPIKSIDGIKKELPVDKQYKSVKQVVEKDDDDDNDDDDDDDNDDENDDDDDGDNKDDELYKLKLPIKDKSVEKIKGTATHVKETHKDLNKIKQSKEDETEKSKVRLSEEEIKPRNKDVSEKSNMKIKQPIVSADATKNIVSKEIKIQEKDIKKNKIEDSYSTKKDEIKKDKRKADVHIKKSEVRLADTKIPEAKTLQEKPIDFNDTPQGETKSKKIRDESMENESRENDRLKHVTDALHRRNLLKSEFDDFYAFLPTFAPNFTRVKNPECRRHGQILLRQLRGTKLWALNMLDATAKIPSGILQGNGIQLGDFDQCLQSRARVQLDTGSVVKVQGKYCLARIDLKAEHPELEVPVYLAQGRSLIKSRIDDPGHFVPRFSTLSWGVCVPVPCDSEDVEAVVRDAVKHYQYTSGVSIRVKVDPLDCHMQHKQPWWEEWLEVPTLLTLAFYAVIVLLVLVATVQDFLARRKTEDGSSDEPQERNEKKLENEQSDGNVDKSPAENLVSAFSLYRTVSKLVAPATSDEISCIHGVRAIATIALLVAHKFLPVAVMPYTNRVKISEIVSSPIWSWCRAGWMYTDCFLLLSGTLTAHRISADNESGAPKRILNRYLRLTPALLAVILFYAYVWDNISVGPMWGSLVTKNAEVCQQGWWWNILYVQNYFGFEDMCAPQTHQLALDMQLSILGGVVVWAMQSDMPVLRALLPTLHVWTAFSRYKTTRDHRLTLLAYHGVRIFTVIGSVISVMSVTIFDWPVDVSVSDLGCKKGCGFEGVSQLYRTARLSYTSVIHRSTPYLVGLSLGLSLKSDTRHSKILMAFGWLVSGLLWSLVWWAGLDSGSTQYRYNATFAAQYAALAPISSALAIAWLIYAVHSGHCDFLQTLLCSRPLALISRLSYALYLCQFIVFLTNAATVKTSSEFTLISLIDVQEMSMILLTSVLLTLTFVIPMQSLPKILTSISKTGTNTSSGEKTEEQQESPKNNEKVMEHPKIRNRQTLIAHREVLEEIPEVEVEYEHQRDFNDGLEEILEEEEDEEAEEEPQRGDAEDLEIIEEEQGADEDFWANREEEGQIRPISRDSDRDLDDWEVTGNGTGQSGAQHYRYSIER